MGKREYTTIMKKLIVLICILVCVCGMASCDSQSGKDHDEVETFSFNAKVLETHDSYLLVEPLADSNECKSADRIQVSLKNKTTSWTMPNVGDLIKIVYDGTMMETYPAQLGEVYHIEVLTVKAAA